MSEFTNGKWATDTRIKRVSCAVWRTVRKADSNIESDDMIAYIPRQHNGISEEEALANARLIAAAPEMYKLLKVLVYREYDNTVIALLALEAEKLLTRIDSTEDDN